MSTLDLEYRNRGIGMTGEKKTWFARSPRSTPVVCRFSGCDDDASTTVGTTALCALHRTFVEQLMDSGAACVTAERAIAHPVRDIT